MEGNDVNSAAVLCKWISEFWWVASTVYWLSTLEIHWANCWYFVDLTDIFRLRDKAEENYVSFSWKAPLYSHIKTPQKIRNHHDGLIRQKKRLSSRHTFPDSLLFFVCTRLLGYRHQWLVGATTICSAPKATMWRAWQQQWPAAPPLPPLDPIPATYWCQSAGRDLSLHRLEVCPVLNLSMISA